MKGQPVSSRFQFMAESRNGHDVVVTRSPHSSEHFKVHLLDENGRESESVFVYGRKAMASAVNEYLEGSE